VEEQHERFASQGRTSLREREEEIGINREDTERKGEGDRKESRRERGGYREREGERKRWG
jgi:hypothetical protein